MSAAGLLTWVGGKDVLCDFCKGTIPRADLRSGRSLVLLSQRYCGRCLEESVMQAKFQPPAPRAVVGSVLPSARRPSRKTSPATVPAVDAKPAFGSDPAPAAPGAERSAEDRANDRFIPPRDATLSIQRYGWMGHIVGDLVRHWLDVSEGGVRAIVSGRVEVGDILSARIGYRPYQQMFEVSVCVQHLSESQKYPGSFVAGFSFVGPSPALRMCIRAVMSSHPAIAERALRKLWAQAEAKPAAASEPAVPPAAVAPSVAAH